jgi:nitrogen-specific signal transduction histidine kinase
MGVGLAVVQRGFSDHGRTTGVERRPGCTVVDVALPVGSGATEVS